MTARARTSQTILLVSVLVPGATATAVALILIWAGSGPTAAHRLFMTALVLTIASLLTMSAIRIRSDTR